MRKEGEGLIYLPVGRGEKRDEGSSVTTAGSGYSDVYLLVDIHIRSRCRVYFTDYTAFGPDMSSVYGVQHEYVMHRLSINWTDQKTTGY